MMIISLFFFVFSFLAYEVSYSKKILKFLEKNEEFIFATDFQTVFCGTYFWDWLIQSVLCGSSFCNWSPKSQKWVLQ